MDAEKLRRQICFEAARLLNSRQETNFTTAKWRAARSITSSYIATASLPTDLEIRLSLQQLVSSSTPGDLSVDETDHPGQLPDSRFDQYFALLEPMDSVRMNRHAHPEGDLLYHSLQVYELAYEARPWDEEFLVAALLHDVGYGIDPFDPETATIRAVQEIVSDRSLWLIENLPLQHRIAEGTIGVRARRRLAQHEDEEELRLLAECDLNGRLPGRHVSDLASVIQTIKDVSWDPTES